MTQPSGWFHRCTCLCPSVVFAGSIRTACDGCRFHTCRPVYRGLAAARRLDDNLVQAPAPGGTIVACRHCAEILGGPDPATRLPLPSTRGRPPRPGLRSSPTRPTTWTRPSCSASTAAPLAGPRCTRPSSRRATPTRSPASAGSPRHRPADVGGGLDVLPVGHPPRRDPRPYDGTRPGLFGMNRQPNVPGACLSNRSRPRRARRGGAGRQHGDLGRLARRAEVWSSLPYMMGPIFSLSGAGDF